MQGDLEEALIEGYVVPAAAPSGRVAVDRVSVPMEEVVAAEERAAQPEERKRKVWRHFRLAYCATLTFCMTVKGKLSIRSATGGCPKGRWRSCVGPWPQTCARGVTQAP